MKTTFITFIVATSVSLSSCLQNDSHPVRCWIGIGDCKPTVLQGQIKVLDIDGTPVQNYHVAIMPKPPDGIIPTPYYGDFIDKERALNGEHCGFRVTNGQLKIISEPKVPKNSLASSEPLKVSLSKDGTVKITYSTYFPESLRIGVGSNQYRNGVKIRPFPKGKLELIRFEKLERKDILKVL